MLHMRLFVNYNELMFLTQVLNLTRMLHQDMEMFHVQRTG
jgi:hypothetical protein